MKKNSCKTYNVSLHCVNGVLYDNFGIYTVLCAHTVISGGRRGHDRMIVEFTTTCAISAYHHQSCEFEHRSWRGVLNTTSCDKMCKWLVSGRWFSRGTPVSSTNKTDRHDITEILLKVAWNTTTVTLHCINELDLRR
jgi:hypothetical protein